MNNKGFMMAEVVVVSSIILVALVGLYTSYNKIFSIYNQRINYYDVSTLYELAYVRDITDFTTKTPSTTTNMYSNDGTTVYYIDKTAITSLKSNVVLNQTFKDYLQFLGGDDGVSGLLDVDELKINGTSVSNILVMEKCDSDGKSNCKYAYLEVADESS